MPRSVEAAVPQEVEVQTSWRAIRRSTTKVAFTIQELVGLTSEFSTRKAPNCTSKVVRTDASKFLLVYHVTCRESYSDPNGHTVRLKFDFKRLKESGKATDLDVRVSCSCPAFLYWGAQWNLSTGDALYGAPRPKFQPPTEPRRYQFVVCKHVKVVADRIAPVIDRMLSGYRSTQDEAEEQERLKQVEVVKQRTQLDVDQKEEEMKGKPEEPVEEAPARKPITPKTEEPVEDLDAMPEDLTTLGLPSPTPEAPRPPVTPKVVEPPPEQTEPEEGPMKPPEPIKRPKRPGPKPKRRPEPTNVQVFDDEDDTTTVLPGSKARRMLQDELDDVEFFPVKDEKIPPAPKARRMLTPKPGKPHGLPPNIKLIDDDSDDQVTKINRLKQAALLGGLVLAEGC